MCTNLPTELKITFQITCSPLLISVGRSGLILAATSMLMLLSNLNYEKLIKFANFFKF